MAYAHSPNERDEWHDLVDHLRGTAALAEAFGVAIGAAEAARYLGLVHDIGKFDPEWQRYLRESHAGLRARGTGPDHKAAGTSVAMRRLGPAALVVQAHHGGLHTPNDLRDSLARAQTERGPAEALALARQALPDLEPVGPIPLPAHIARDPLAAELFLRLLFSALVDADRLDTERHDTRWKAAIRGTDITLAELWERFERDRRRFDTVEPTAVNRARREIYDACLAAAELPPGLFRLTVPTGGGKTRSGMAFALRHAIRHGMRRVIVAVPFITITEQTTAEYRAIFDDEDTERPVVLEHHSNAGDRDAHDEGFARQDVWTRLAAENWDAPVIVTTTVQLFESLFAARTSKARRAHRLAGSVIILDEAQALPAHLLDPILDALRRLCAHHGATAVLSTATQPAFEAIPVFAAEKAREIVPDPGRYFAALKRVTYEWEIARSLDWAEVAALMRDERRALAVVNTKKDALALLDALGDSEALHLSTMLCGAHRRAVVAEVKRRQTMREPCRLVATQVVEAGVDIDFPLVLRALGPLDAIIQAAGRCNREGLLDRGRMVVFRPTEGGLPGATYRTATDITGAVLGGSPIDLDDPAVPRAYFERLFETVSTDREGIQKLRSAFEFPTVAEKFRMIDDDTESVAVTSYGSTAERRLVAEILDALRRGTPESRRLLRRLQPYLVTVRRRDAERYRREGFISPVIDGVGEWMGKYDERQSGLVAADQEYFA